MDALPPPDLSVTATRQSVKRSAAKVSLPAGFEAIAYGGGGSISEVWKARCRQSGDVVALKQLRPEWINHAVARNLLMNEVEVGRQVRSNYVVRLFDADLTHDPPYTVLEWLAGETLEAVLQREQRLPCQMALWIARQAATGMEDIRQSGYIHGDIKPANIFLESSGRAKLIDLGFARRCRAADGDLTPSINILTGTPHYMPPEATVPGKEWNVARDIYSLGVALYRMLSGRLPFDGHTSAEVLRQQREAVPQRVRRFAPDIPVEVEHLVQELLAKQPLRRPGSLQRLIRRLLGLELRLMR